MKRFNRIFTVAVFIFLYAPILLLVAASFSSGTSLSNFEGFTLSRYSELFSDKNMLGLLLNSLIVALISSVVASVFGTVSCFGIRRLGRRAQKAVMTVTNIPMTNPEIVTGISLALLFVFIGQMLKLKDVMGFWTLLIAHITFNLPYVILSVMPKLNQLDRHVGEAALDLGCTPIKAFFKVTLPEILPGIISGGLMAFTMSLDDFVISYFVGSSNFQTLPLLIYSMTKKKVTPDMYALSTLIIVTVFVLLVISNIKSGKKAADNGRRAKK